QNRDARTLARGVGEDLPGLVRATELENTDGDQEQDRQGDCDFEQRLAGFCVSGNCQPATSSRQAERSVHASGLGKTRALWCLQRVWSFNCWLGRQLRHGVNIVSAWPVASRRAKL
ncbi:MAG TPA: hypothetical protein VKE51_34935, partial [Vicinamibacterales bacterium]|nr:hypothetical protein [Vicinamibacterales bacterium]